MPSSSPTEEIKERLDIADVVGGYVKLTRSGNYLKAVCPFHNEKTPSFFVNPDRGTFYCFGCGAKGDVFSFVQQFEGIDFPQALARLAERAGVEVRREDPQQRQQRNTLYQVMEDAAAIFERNIAGEQAVADYLAGRGLTAASIARWRLGYAQNEWRALFDELKAKGYTDELLEQAGLIKRREGSGKEASAFYDRFRGRIMFPINDSSGRVVGFSGRLFVDENDNSEAPKYLNSPETPLYNKSRILYGFDKAKLAIRKYNCSVVVEGQMDVVASHQAGFTNTVAVSGTALTEHQLTMIKRLSPNVVLAFDADEAGIASAGKSAKLALSLGMNVKVAALPSGVDPSDIVKEGKEGLREVIRNAEHVVDFYLDMLSRASYDSRTFRLHVHELVLPFIRSIENKIDQAHFVSTVAGRLSVPEEVVWEELRKLPLEKPRSSGGGVRAQAAAARAPLSRKDVLFRSLNDLLVWQKNADEPAVDTDALASSLATITAEHPVLTRDEDDEKDDPVFRAEAVFATTGDLQAETDDMLRRLEIELLKDRLVETMHELKKAESAGDSAATTAKLQECKDISDAIRKREGDAGE